MKKQLPSLILCITLLFLGFLLGFYTGRNSCRNAVLVSVPAQMLTEPLPPPETEPEIVFPIDLNQADQKAIQELPGIGETLSLRILAYRRERVRFFSVEELKNVEGITDKIYDQIKDLVYIGG